MDRFEQTKESHKSHGRIYFTEIRETNSELIVKVTQGRTTQENYASKERLEEITRDLYALKERFRKHLVIHAFPSILPPQRF